MRDTITMCFTPFAAADWRRVIPLRSTDEKTNVPLVMDRLTFVTNQGVYGNRHVGRVPQLSDIPSLNAAWPDGSATGRPGAEARIVLRENFADQNEQYWFVR